MLNKVHAGSISSGTLKSEDLIETFSEELLRLGNTDFEAEAKRWLDAEEEERECNGQDLVDDMITALDNLAPPYFYFGTLEGDGADFGFWLSRDSLEDFDGLKVSDTSEVPDNYTGEVLHINDHGNVTLYVASADKQTLREVWAIV